MSERDCNTCKHHVQGRSIDDAPPKCWDCIGSHTLSQWQPTEGEETVSDGATEMVREAGSFIQDAIGSLKTTWPYPTGKSLVPPPNPLDTQVGGNHYKGFTIQPIEFAIANNLDFFQKDVIKYVCRHKGDKAKRIEDLNKAKHYIDLYIQAIDKGQFD